jgi:colanic acid/amylovoran biosynthesis glycosyltransferase
MKIIHLWLDYSPNLFDRCHPLALAHGVDSEVLCRNLIDNDATIFPKTRWINRILPTQLVSRSIFRRVIGRVRREVDNRKFARLVRLRVEKSRPDAVHVHFGTTGAALRQLDALPDVPFIVSFYGVDVSAALNDRKVVAAYRDFLPKAKLLHVLCEQARQRLLALGCDDRCIRVANLPIDIAAFSRLRPAAPENRVRFLIPSRFIEKKGHRVALQAMQLLLARGSHAIALTCFGYGATAWLTEAIKQAGLTHCVTVIDNGLAGDFVKQYQTQLLCHDIILAPSVRSTNGDDEGGPALTVVMAQAAAKPVIVSDFPGAERSVSHGCEGLVASAGDAGALSHAMQVLIDNPSQWGVLGLAGRARVLEEFSEQVFWTNLVQWYRAQ